MGRLGYQKCKVSEQIEQMKQLKSRLWAIRCPGQENMDKASWVKKGPLFLRVLAMNEWNSSSHRTYSMKPLLGSCIVQFPPLSFTRESADIRWHWNIDQSQQIKASLVSTSWHSNPPTYRYSPVHNRKKKMIYKSTTRLKRINNSQNVPTTSGSEICWRFILPFETGHICCLLYGFIPLAKHQKEKRETPWIWHVGQVEMHQL